MTDGPMAGKTVVITGASAGLGAIAAQRLAEQGATIVAIGRSPEKTRAVCAQLGIEPLIADFARLDDVRETAAAVLERCPRIDVLANNAGALVQKRTTTVDGHELTFQANHLAPFLLTALLRERLAATPGARVVTTASIANRFGSVKLDNLDSEGGPFIPFRVYATSKLENILFTRELARRAVGDGITAVCFHPGAVASEFGRDSFATGLLYRTPLKRLVLTPEQGAAPLIELATRPDVETLNGMYFDRHKPNGPTARQANDEKLAAALWDRSAEITGVPA